MKTLNNDTDSELTSVNTGNDSFKYSPPTQTPTDAYVIKSAVEISLFY